jgi:hypothetical protein
MDVGCSQWGFEASTMTPQHHTGSAIPHFPDTPPHLNTYYGYNDAPICPSTASQGAKHFVYIQYGCGIESMRVFSLNHDTATSYCHRPWYWRDLLPDNMARLAKMQDCWSKRRQTLFITRSQGQSNQWWLKDPLTLTLRIIGNSSCTGYPPLCMQTGGDR